MIIQDNAFLKTCLKLLIKVLKLLKLLAATDLTHFWLDLTEIMS